MNPITEKKIKECAQVAYTTMGGIYNTYDMSVYCFNNKIEGDFVEMGVACGSQIGVMGIACKEFNTIRSIWGFDSFQGIPMACEKDTVQPGLPNMKTPTEEVIDKRPLLVSSGITVHKKAVVENNLNLWGLKDLPYKLIEGWFQDTLPIWERHIDKIALLRLDGDLYDSTIVSLNHLYPKVSNGGVIIIDDYELVGVQVALNEYFNGAVPQLIPITTIRELDYGAKYFLKP